jgi:hypothetical protein
MVTKGALLTGFAALFLGSCTVRHAVDFSSRPEPVVVAIPCGETYKVYDERTARRLTVASSVIQEVGRGECPDFERLYKTERFARVATNFLSGSDDKCQVSGSEILSLSEIRFTYRCAGDPEPKTPGKAKKKPHTPRP